jgi:hypothetical protein
MLWLVVPIQWLLLQPSILDSHHQSRLPVTSSVLSTHSPPLDIYYSAAHCSWLANLLIISNLLFPPHLPTHLNLHLSTQVVMTAAHQSNFSTYPTYQLWISHYLHVIKISLNHNHYPRRNYSESLKIGVHRVSHSSTYHSVLTPFITQLNLLAGLQIWSTYSTLLNLLVKFGLYSTYL